MYVCMYVCMSPLCLMRQLAHLFLPVCGQILVRNSPREAVSTMLSMFDIFLVASRGDFLTKFLVSHIAQLFPHLAARFKSAQ